MPFPCIRCRINDPVVLINAKPINREAHTRLDVFQRDFLLWVLQSSVDYSAKDKRAIYFQGRSTDLVLQIPHDKIRHHLSHVLDQYRIGDAVA